MSQPQDTVSSTRLYLGSLPRNITKQEVEDHFSSHGAGTIKEIKLMNGFGFIEYEDMMDARDVVPAFHGTLLKGERMTVQFAHGHRRKDNNGPQERQAPRPRRTIYRMQITGLQSDTSWQDLKDFARSAGTGLDVVYSETGRSDGKGLVEFETSADLKTATEKLDGREFKGVVVHCVADVQDERDVRPYRQRSPLARGRYGPPADDYYDRRGPPPPRPYSPRAYRERSPGRSRPPPYDEYYDRAYARRTPPPRDPYPPAPRRYEEPYDSRAPPPARGYDPYPRGDPYARPRSPPPARGYGSYGGGGGGGGNYGAYDDRRY